MDQSELQNTLHEADLEGRRKQRTTTAMMTTGVSFAGVGGCTACVAIAPGIIVGAVGMLLCTVARASASGWTPAELRLAGVLSTIENPGSLPSLTAALGCGSINMQRVVRGNVARLLSSLCAEDALQCLRDEQCRLLMQELAGFRQISHHPDGEDEQFLLAVLHAFRIRLYAPALSELRRIHVDAYVRVRPHIAAALTDCMTALAGEARRQAEGAALLRAAEAPAGSVDNLLTPAHGPVDADSELLLRSTVAE